MNVAQAEFAVPYLRVAGVAKVLAPLVKQKHYESLKAAATVAYLVGGDEEGELFDLLSDNKHAIDKIVDLLENTLNLKGCVGSYDYGVFPLHSSVRAIKILSKSDNFKDYLLSKNCFALLHRTLSQFITDTNAGYVGGGAADVESAALAVEALHELSYPSPTSSTSALDIVTKKVDSNLGSLTDLLSAYKERSSVKSSKEYASSTSTATALIDRISLLANEIKVKKAVAAMKKRQSIARTPTSEHPADADQDAAVNDELLKAKEALGRNLANAKEKARLLEEKIALSEKTSNENNTEVAALTRKFAEAEAAKLKFREEEMEAKMNKMIEMMERLHTKTDVIMKDVKDIKKTVKETLSSLQNFFTNESPVPRFILIGPPANSQVDDKIGGILSGSFLLKSTTASLNVLCAHDLSIACTFQIEEPRKWVKNYAPALKLSLRALKLVAAGTKMATGLPFSIPDTSSFDKFLGEANDAISDVFGESELAGSDDRAALTKIESGEGDEKTRKITGASYAKLKHFFEDEGRMKKLTRTMDKVRGKDGKEEWVSFKNLDMFCAENDATSCEGEDEAEVQETVAEKKNTAAPASDILAASSPPPPPSSESREQIDVLSKKIDGLITSLSLERSSTMSSPSSSITSPSQYTGTIVYEGNLEKRGGGRSLLGSTAWKERFFRLTTTSLKYYDKAGSEKSLGAIILAGATAKVVGATEFDLMNEDAEIRTFHLRAKTKFMMDTWLEKLKQVGLKVEG
ncbi:hypothetical protein TrCOL_g99 [Triparma columacea]|nr:hypothetical protein TrCOL_g99 [Triparma columacea]